MPSPSHCASDLLVQEHLSEELSFTVRTSRRRDLLLYLYWLPRERLQGTTSTPVVPVFFGRKISNVGGVNHKNKPAQRVPWRFLSLKKYKIVFFGPILLEL